jgi:hypothetical protein
MRRFAVLALVLVACDTAEIDPSLSGVFPCRSASDCPATQTCVLQTCYREAPPRLEVMSPEAEVAFPVGDDEFVSVVIKIGGDDLDLVDPRHDPDQEFGRGNVLLLVDGEEQAVLTSGDLTSGVTMQVLVEAVAGPHRIQAIARNSAGVPYDNEGAEARRLFWVDDGAARVAFLEPFPGDVFPLDAAEIAVGLATLNFTLNRPGGENVERLGHVHVHYDELFPACAFEPVCEANQIGMVIAPAPANAATGTVDLPSAVEGEATLTALLRKQDHSLYFYPPWTEDPVWEDIVIRRAKIESAAD